MWDCEHIWETKILIKAIGDAARYYVQWRTAFEILDYGVAVMDISG